jgi:hypothetical protein
MVDRFVFAGAESPDNDGNVFTPQGRSEGRHGRWSLLGRAHRRARG